MSDNKTAGNSSESTRPLLRLMAFVFGAVLAVASIAYAWDHLHVDLCELEGMIDVQSAAAPAAEAASVTEMVAELSLQSVAFASLVFLGALALMLAALLIDGKPGVAPEHTVVREDAVTSEDKKAPSTASSSQPSATQDGSQ